MFRDLLRTSLSESRQLLKDAERARGAPPYSSGTLTLITAGLD